MAQLQVKNLYKIFGPRQQTALKMAKDGKSKPEILEKTGCTLAVNNADFSIAEGETFVVMGLSGSGKSTVLRCLNRLWEPTAGSVILDDVDIVDITDEHLRELRRTKMNMVFQHFGLLPHRTVVDNVAFGLEIQQVALETRQERAYEIIKQVGLEGYGDMMTGELSGGMQQRVGLARALATDPDILLMDEAFSALDPLIRTQMQDELLDLQEQMQKTIVFITHDLDEALKLGDRIAIMKDGYIVQIGTPDEILTQPADDYVASFVQNVDRSKVITASSLMFDHPSRVVSPKDGVEVAIRRMRKMGISSLAVTGPKRAFKGYVRIDDAVKIQKKGEGQTLEDVVMKDVPRTHPDTPIAELLPHVMESPYPIAVVDDEGRLQGLVMRSSVISEITGVENTDTPAMLEDEA
jgi:glycine betaine/proline transport system ATP-binding protein